MKRCVQILLLAVVLAPVLAPARTETMAERKRRLERKYLHENATVAHTGTMVPDEMAAEEEQIQDSEKFQEVQVDLQRQGSAAPMPPPRVPRPRPMPRKANSNWLLATPDDAEGGDDASSTDSFSWDDSSSRDTKKKKPDRSAEWRRRDAYYNNNENRQEGWFTRRTDSAAQVFGTRASSFGKAGAATTVGNAYGTSGRSLFGKRKETDSQTASPFRSPAEAFRPAGAGTTGTGTPAANPFKVQFPSYQSGGSAGTVGVDAGRRSGYTPYRNSFQSQTVRQRQWGSGTTTPVGGQFPKTDNFQKWKQDSYKKLDPTRDDAFIDALMPKVQQH